MEIKKKMEDIKEKSKEIKNKILTWKDEHMDTIIIGGCTVILGFASGVYGYFLGKDVGEIEGYNVCIRTISSEFEENQGLIGLKDTGTGKMKAIMTKEFCDLMHENSNIIQNENGSWKFESEAE